MIAADLQIAQVVPSEVRLSLVGTTFLPIIFPVAEKKKM